MCVYDGHPFASRDTIPSNQELVEYQATKSWLEYTTTQQARAGRNIIKNVLAFCNQGKPGTCVQVKLCSCTCKQEKLGTNV